jgi:hypothetical protein
VNIYYDNKAHSNISSPQIKLTSNLNYLFHSYLGLKAVFNTEPVDDAWHCQISGQIANNDVIDSFVIGGSNADRFNVSISNHVGNTLFNATLENREYFNIASFEKGNGAVYTINCIIENHADIYVEYLFIGPRLEMPPFTVGPGFAKKFRGSADRGYMGQVYGLRQPPLKEISLSFPRVENKTVKLIDAYADAVENVVPHLIDPYPEAHKEKAPLYCTLEDGIEEEKREESGFFMMFDLSWQEAK